MINQGVACGCTLFSARARLASVAFTGIEMLRANDETCLWQEAEALRARPARTGAIPVLFFFFRFHTLMMPFEGKGFTIAPLDTPAI